MAIDTRSSYLHRQYREARDAYRGVSYMINPGNTNVLAAVFNEEHPTLLSKVFTAAAMAVLTKTYDSLCPEASIFKDEPHPEHDGRLHCGEVIGTLRILAVKRGDDVLDARRFWIGRVFDPLTD